MKDYLLYDETFPIKAEFLYGDIDQERKNAILKDFKDGKIDVLITTFGSGLSFPLATPFLLFGGRSTWIDSCGSKPCSAV